MTSMSFSPEIMVEFTSYPFTPAPVCTFSVSLACALMAVASAIEASKVRLIIRELYIAFVIKYLPIDRCPSGCQGADHG